MKNHFQLDHKHKEPDSPETRHDSTRKKARDNTFKAAIGMANYYNKKKCTTSNQLKKGDVVSFQVPKIDRSCTDLQRIPGVIIDVSEGEQIQFYQVATTAGVIKTKFRTGDLTVYNGSVSPITDKYLTIKLIRQTNLLSTDANARENVTMCSAPA